MCPIDPESLKVGSPLTIVDDRACINCGYSLRGLRLDQVCPECGRAIQVKKKNIPRYSDALINAPKLWLAGLALGSTFLFFGVLGMLLLFFATSLMPADAKFAFSIFAGAATLIWYIGVLITTQPRPMMPTTRLDPRKEWRGLRWSARLTQFFWPVLSGLLTASWYQYKQGGVPSPVFAWLAFGAFIIGAMGLIWLCVYLSNIAFWGDDDVGANFRTCAWMIGAAATLAVLNAINVLTNAVLMGGFWASLVYALLLFFMVVPELYLVYCLFQLQHMARWSITNHAIADAKTRRLRAQAKKNAQRGPAVMTSKVPEQSEIELAEDSTVNPVSAAPEPAPMSRIVTAVRPRKGEGETPYDVEER